MTLIALGLAWLFGLAAGRGLEPSPLLALPIIASCAAALIGRRCTALRWSGAVLAVVLLGVWRGALAAPLVSEGPLTPYRGQRVTLEGTVVEAPRCGPRSCVFILHADRLETVVEMVITDARVQVRTRSAPAELFGRRLRASGELSAPRPLLGYPSDEILARRGVYEVLNYPRLRTGQLPRAEEGSPFDAWREQATRVLSDRLPGRAAELVAGLLLGQATPPSPELAAALRATGTSHIVAVSGFNVALVGGAFLVFGRRVMGPTLAGLLGVGAVVLYTLLVGAPASAIRAALMFGITVLAALVGRLPDALTSLVVAAAVMVGLDPTLLTDLGFQLSFVATAGLVLYGQWRVPKLPPLLRAAVAGLAATVAAELATLPLVVHTFHQASLIAPLANLLIAPALPVLVAAGGAFLLLAAVPFLSNALAWIIQLLSGYVLGVIETLAGWPLASFTTGGLPSWALIASYGCLLAPKTLAWLGRTRPPDQQRAWLRAGLVVPIAGLIGVALLSSVRWPMGGALRAEFFDVGGDGLSLLETAGGRRILVGTAGSVLAAGALAERLPLLDRAIDLLVVTRGGASSSLEGLSELVRRFPVGAVLQPSMEWEGAEGWTGLLASRGIVVVPADTGTVVELGDEVRLVVEDAFVANGSSALALRLESGAFDLLFAAGRLGVNPARARPLLVRLQPDAAVERRVLSSFDNNAWHAVIGGRPRPDSDESWQFPLEADAVVELRSEGEGFLLRYARCPRRALYCSRQRVLGGSPLAGSVDETMTHRGPAEAGPDDR